MGARRLVRELGGDVRDARVLGAMRAVPRELFVPGTHARDAWANTALPIGCGQTISQPLVVARMCEVLELRGDERVLDVGTGSGYHAAVLGALSGHVWSIERHPELSAGAASALAAAGATNVTLLVGDGTLGLPEQAPFDAINVAAAAPDDVPAALMDQLAAGGRLVAPVGEEEQRLMLLRRTADGHEAHPLERVRFVPLVGAG